MATTPSLLHFRLLPIPEALWVNRVDVERRSTADADGNIYRDDTGQPTGGYEVAIADFRCAVVDVGAFEQVRFLQAGQEVTHRVYFPRHLGDSYDGSLPDVRPGDRLRLYPDRPSGEARYLAVGSADDLEQAGLLLEVRCRELPPGDQRGYPA